MLWKPPGTVLRAAATVAAGLAPALSDDNDQQDAAVGAALAAAPTAA